VTDSWFSVPGSRFLVLGSWFSVLGSWFLVLGSWFLVLSSRFSVLGSWFLVLGSQFSVPGSWFSVLGSQFSALGSQGMEHAIHDNDQRFAPARYCGSALRTARPGTATLRSRHPGGSVQRRGVGLACRCGG